MCGIAGIRYFSARQVRAADLQRMAALLRHRGPDATGLWRDGPAGLAHTRLEIVDPGPASSQPMVSSDGSVVVSYNGEIHNYPELRDELSRLGHVFRTAGDVEVLLAAYRQWGAGAFGRFNGMWAVAIWDARRQCLVLCRDRFGIKPLYYVCNERKLVFASEAKAILAVAPEEARVNETELLAYLRNADPDGGGATFFENVRSVPPAHWLEVGPEGAVREQCYWRLPENRLTLSPPEAASRFAELFDDAVRLRMRSDVPVGAALSGGMDSSAVVQSAAAHHHRLDCFSLRYPGERYDESHYAELVARAAGARVHWIEPDPREILRHTQEIVWAHDSPPPIRGRLPSWPVMKAAGRHVRVILEGDGSDELLAGYAFFLGPYIADGLAELRRKPSLAGLRRHIHNFAAMNDVRGGRRSLLHTIIRDRMRTALGRYRHQPFLSRALARRQVSLSPLRSRSAWKQPSGLPHAGHLDNALWLEFFHCGLPEVLHAADVTSMAFSVESRAPFLDHRLVEFCFSLDASHKIRDGWTKRVLRDAFADRLPEEVTSRRAKLGYPAPYGEWFARPDVYDETVAILLSESCLQRGLYDRRALQRQFASRRNGTAFVRSHVAIVWRMLALETWFRQFIDARPSALPFAA